jgi:2-C-methyl-D-erythritol 4-phosphate cytidylyltransferase
MMRYWVVMPAAGVGRRFGGAQPKQYAPLAGRTVIEWALAPFLADARCAGIRLALAEGDPYWPPLAAQLAPEHAARITLAPGGPERSHSVLNGLASLEADAPAEEWVLVHDAARPCLPPQDLERLLVELGTHPVGGLLAARLADTIKREGEARSVAATVDRSGLWRALTPQMFRLGMLKSALARVHADGRLPTDEAQAVEWLGERPVLVEGSAANIKVTSAADLLIAAALLTARDER